MGLLNQKNRMDAAVEQAILAFAPENPATGQFAFPTNCASEVSTSVPLGALGLAASCGVGEEAAEEGLLLTEVQVAALERKPEEQQEIGEIETAHPGYLGSQDTFYVGNVQGVSRIYQQTPIAAADLRTPARWFWFSRHTDSSG